MVAAVFFAPSSQLVAQNKPSGVEQAQQQHLIGLSIRSSGSNCLPKPDVFSNETGVPRHTVGETCTRRLPSYVVEDAERDLNRF